MRPLRPAPQGSDWIACVMQEVQGDRVPIKFRAAPLLFSMVGPEHLRFELNGTQLEVYVYQPRRMPKPPTWVQYRDGMEFVGVLRGRR